MGVWGVFAARSAVAVASLAIVCLARTASAQVPEPCCPGGTSHETTLKGWLPEPRIFANALNKFDRGSEKRAPKSGFFVRFGRMVPGAGWISLGPGYRQMLARDHVRLEASGAVSWRGYKAAEAITEVSGWHRHLSIGVSNEWEDFTQANYYGLGINTSLTQRTEYRLQAADHTAYLVVRAGMVALGGRLGIMTRPHLSEPAGWHDPGFPDIHTFFNDGSAPGLAHPPALNHADVIVTVDGLDHADYPRRGALAQVSTSWFGDRDGGPFSFKRHEAALLLAAPLAQTWTLLARGSAIVTDVDAGQRVPFYLLPSLGAQNGLRGFHDYRFADRDLAALVVESRWALMPHVDVLAFAELGKVAGSVSELRQRPYRRDLGFGLSIHSKSGTVFVIETGHGAEGWHVVVKTGEPLMFSIFTRWAAVLPIGP